MDGSSYANIIGYYADSNALDVYDSLNQNRVFGNINLRSNGNLVANVYGDLVKPTTIVSGNLVVQSTLNPNVRSGNPAMAVLGTAMFSKDVWIDGNLFINGTTTTSSMDKFTTQDALLTLNEGRPFANILAEGAGLEFYATDSGVAGNIIGYIKTEPVVGSNILFKAPMVNGVVVMEPPTTNETSRVILGNVRNQIDQRIFNSNLVVDRGISVGNVLPIHGNVLNVGGNMSVSQNIYVGGGVTLSKTNLGSSASRISVVPNGTLSQSVSGRCGVLYLQSVQIGDTGDLVNFTVQNPRCSEDSMVFINLLNHDGSSFAPTVYSNATSNGSFNIQISSPYPINNGNLDVKYLIF